MGLVPLGPARPPSSRVKSHQVEDGAEGQPHGTGGDPLGWPVEVHPAGENVGARQTHLRQHRSIRSAANRRQIRIHARSAHRFLQAFGNFGPVLQVLVHVGVGRLDLHLTSQPGLVVQVRWLSLELCFIQNISFEQIFIYFLFNFFLNVKSIKGLLATHLHFTFVL